MTKRRWLTIALALLASGLGTACVSGRYRAAIEVPEGDVARVIVHGSCPTVRIENAGPGRVRVEVEGEDGTPRGDTVLGVGSTVWSAVGPMILILTSTGPGPATVTLKAEDTTGLAIDPASPPLPDGRRAEPPEHATPSPLTMVRVRIEPPGAFDIEGTGVSGAGLDELAAGLRALSQTRSDRVYEVVSEWKLTPAAEAQIRAAFRGASAPLRHLCSRGRGIVS